MKIEEATVVVQICLKIKQLDRIEGSRGTQNRSAYIREILNTYFDAIDEVRA
jgi:hypothetical protein